MSGTFLPGQRVGRILIGPDELAKDRAASGGSDRELRSAFPISGSRVLTAWHCAGRDADAPLWFRLRTADGSYRYLPVRVASHDEILDVAVLALDSVRLADAGGLAGGGLTEAAARELLAEAAIPLAGPVPVTAKMWVTGFSGGKPAYDSDTYEVTVVQPEQLPSGVSSMKLQGPEFGAVLPVLVHGLSGGPVLRAVDPDAGPASGYAAVGFVRGSVGKDLPSRGGAVIATRIADAAHLPEIRAALRADAGKTHRVPAYDRVIRKLIPRGGLPDRGPELAELAAFARPGSAKPPYAIWLGPHGYGKTALAAYFAKNPPPGVDVVAFFVSRYEGRQARDFWTDACDQLAALLDRGTVAVGSSTLFADLWVAAGLAAAAAGRTLLLLIDGLEEDDPRLSSPIYRSIPDDGDASRRVVIFSSPAAVGADRDFALPAGKYVRHGLIKSAQAQVIEDNIALALDTRLTSAMRYVLGVMAAAQSPLGALDIAEVLHESGLLGQPKATARSLMFEIEQVLDEADQLGLVSPTLEDQESYAFQGDLAREQVVRKLGAATVADHQEQIKAWAAGYAEKGWPKGTPRYLLAGYPVMLSRTSDNARLLALTMSAEPVDTYAKRVERLRAVTGSDTAAVDELTLVLNHLASADPPDVALACATALRREQMLLSMAWYPVSLIQAKAMLGDWSAARHLAAHLESPEFKAQALVIIGYNATAAGRVQLGHDLLVEALRAVSGITQSYWRISAMWMVARTAASAPWVIDPRTVVGAFPVSQADPLAPYLALSAFAVCTSRAGRMIDAPAFLDEAYRLAAAARSAEAEAEAEAEAGPPNALLGVARKQRAAELYRGAISIIGEPAETVAREAAASGDTETAVKVAALMPEIVDRIRALTDAYQVSATAAEGAEPAIAALLDLRGPAAGITDDYQRAQALAALAQAGATCGRPADDLLSAARDAAGSVGPRGPRAEALTAVARAALARGPSGRELAADLLAQARTQASGMYNPAEKAQVLTAIGWAMAAAGQADGARAALAADIADPGSRIWALAVAATAAPAGDRPPDALLAEAKSALPSLNESARGTAWNVIGQAAWAAVDLAIALAAAADIADTGRRATARAVITAKAAGTNLTDPAHRAEALAAIAQTITAAGGPGDRVFAAAHAAAAGIIDPGLRGWILGRISQVAFLAGRYAAAAAMTADLTDPAQRAGSLATIARVAANADRPPDDQVIEDLFTRARQTAAGMKDPPQRSMTLGAVGQAAVDARRYAAAAEVVDEMTDPVQRAGSLATIAHGIAVDQQPPDNGASLADGLLSEARALAAAIDDPAQRAWAFGVIIQAVVAGGRTDLGRELLAEAEGPEVTTDPIVHATVLGVLARAANGRPAVAGELFARACRATDVPGNQQRARAVSELSFLAEGRVGWPGFLAAEVTRAAGITDPFERSQLLVALAQAAAEPGHDRLAADTAALIPDTGARIWSLLGLARSAAARADPARADRLFGQACAAAGIPGRCAIDWAPLAIAQTAAAVRRDGLARTAAQAIPGHEYRKTALAALDRIATIRGREPPVFTPTVFDDAWLGVTLEAACAAGWFASADQLAELIDDLNLRARMLLTLATTAAAAGDSGRASAALRAVLAMKGRIARPLLGRALATIVGGLADQDQAQAARELVSGLADCFIPDLLGLAQRLAPGTIDVLTAELEAGARSRGSGARR